MKILDRTFLLILGSEKSFSWLYVWNLSIERQNQLRGEIKQSNTVATVVLHFRTPYTVPDT